VKEDQSSLCILRIATEELGHSIRIFMGYWTAMSIPGRSWRRTFGGAADMPSGSSQPPYKEGRSTARCAANQVFSSCSEWARLPNGASDSYSYPGARRQCGKLGPW
jgi:hypothetical protein